MTNNPDMEAAADSATARPMQRDYLSAQVAQALEARISEGTYTPGTKLPSEARLCAEFGVSRTVMREAVSGLKSRGMLNSSQGRGVYVSEGAHLAPLALDPKAAVSAEAVLKLLELRAGFEVQACVLAARRHTAIQLQRIREQLDSVAAAVRAGRDGIAQDHAFHCAICEATDNEHYLAIEQFLFQYSRVGSRVSRADPRRGIRYATPDRHRTRAHLPGHRQARRGRCRRCGAGTHERRRRTHARRRPRTSGKKRPRPLPTRSCASRACWCHVDPTPTRPQPQTNPTETFQCPVCSPPSNAPSTSATAT